MKTANQLIQKIDDLNTQELNSDSLLNGRLGLVYFYLSLYKHFKEEKYLDKIESNLGMVFKNIEDQTSSLLLDASIENGLSGLGYVLQLLIDENILDAEYKDQVKEINNMVYEDALKLIAEKNYDYVRGPFGILFYLNSVKDEAYVNIILEELMNKFKEDEDFFFYNEYSYIEGVHIGYAHGLCAIIKVLNDIEDERAEFIVRELLKKLSQIIKENNFYIKDKKYYLPRSIHKGDTFEGGLNFRAVLAWSNSDINFSTLIFSLKEKFINKELLEIANQIALESIDKKEEEHTRVWDHRFYFGSSGVLKTYNFLYEKTGIEKFQKSSQYWYEKTLELLEEDNIEEHSLNFLNNLPATTLSILEFEEKKNINWSKLLLI
ncbi:MULTISPECIES: lanthionine synthetase LanC family protein [Flavobacterium]|uniref:Lanthionine synthetase LanC family protein n=1 Tax=Flavobacterium jumunjinense TaxID=998845 RepID=A0ABV5GR92_9FLAO|nr:MULTISPECIES: lanthionine synthetase LanC family protein [Flavobacterium]